MSIVSYVQWSLHNPKDNGVYDFQGIADVEKFVQIATEEDLYIILRPGPYVSFPIFSILLKLINFSHSLDLRRN